MADQKIVLVTGATGRQGGAVARELLTHGFRVKAMTRKPEGDNARALAKLGAEVVRGDFNDSASLDEALRGSWGVFAMQNTWEAGVELEEEQGKRTAEIARKAGVKHFVYTSVASADRKTGIPHFDNKWRIEEKVRSLEFPSYVILRGVFFMENWLSPWFKPGIDQGKVIMGVAPATVLQMVAVKDIGKYGLLAFEKHAELNGRAIDIAGDEKTMPQTAQILSEAVGKRLTFERAPIEEVRKMSEDYAVMLEWFDRVGFSVNVRAIENEFHIKPTPLEEWAREQTWA